MESRRSFDFTGKVHDRPLLRADHLFTAEIEDEIATPVVKCFTERRSAIYRSATETFDRTF